MVSLNNTYFKLVKIFVNEGYKNIKNYVIFHTILILFLLFLQFFDIHDVKTQMFANLFAVIFIMINSYYSCKIFFSDKRSWLVLFSKSKEVIILCFLINIPYFLFINLQLVMLGAKAYIAIMYSLFQYLFSISFGIFLGVYFNIIPIFILAIINFIFFNVYNATSYNNVLSVNTFLYNLDVLNYSSILSILCISIFSFLCITFYFFKEKKFLYLLLIPIFINVFSIGYEYLSYMKVKKESYKSFNIDGYMCYYKGLKEKDAKLLGEILVYSLEEYDKILDVSEKRKIYIEKAYLNDVLWIGNSKPKSFLSDKDKVTINVLSDAMINFNNIDIFSKNYVDDVIDVDNYINVPKNRYQRHLLQGISSAIGRNVGTRLKYNKLKNYYDYYLNFFYNTKYRPNRFNYVYNVAGYIYIKNTDEFKRLYLESYKINNDKEFIELLKNKFNNLYYDKDVNYIITEAFRGKKHE